MPWNWMSYKTEMDVRWCEIASLWAQTWPRPATRAAVPAKQLISAGKKGVCGCVKVQVAHKIWCVADPHQQPTLLPFGEICTGYRLLVAGFLSHSVACRRGTRFANRLIETSRSWSIVKCTPLDGHGPENPHVLTVTKSLLERKNMNKSIYIQINIQINSSTELPEFPPLATRYAQDTTRTLQGCIIESYWIILNEITKYY